MTFKTLVAGGCAAAIALSGATAAFAQAAPAAPNINQGPAVNGICVFSDQQVLGASAVGKAVATRLQQINQQVNAELNGERTTLQNDAKSLEGQRTTLDQNTLERRAADLQVRDNAWQRKVQQRQAELEETQKQALGRIYNEMEPLVQQAYQQKGCSILINRQAVVLPTNPAMDITPQVLAALNSKIQTFTFDRARLDAPAAPAAPTAAAARPPAPAAAAPAPATRR